MSFANLNKLRGVQLQLLAIATLLSPQAQARRVPVRGKGRGEKKRGRPAKSGESRVRRRRIAGNANALCIFR